MGNKINYLKKRIRTLQRGLTLIEMLLYMAVFSILLTVLLQIFFSALDVQLESKSTSSVDQDGTYIIARLEYDIQRAQSVVTPSGYGQPSSTLALQIGGSTYTYGVDANNNLDLVNTNGTNQLNTPDVTVTALNFTKLGNSGGKDTVEVNFQVQSTTQRASGKEIRNFSTTTALR